MLNVEETWESTWDISITHSSHTFQRKMDHNHHVHDKRINNKEVPNNQQIYIEVPRDLDDIKMFVIEF